MGDIKRKVEDSKAGKLSPQQVAAPLNDGKVEVNWGNAEKIKILLLQAMNNNLVTLNTSIQELVKLMKDVKE